MSQRHIFLSSEDAAFRPDPEDGSDEVELSVKLVGAKERIQHPLLSFLRTSRIQQAETYVMNVDGSAASAVEQQQRGTTMQERGLGTCVRSLRQDRRISDTNDRSGKL